MTISLLGVTSGFAARPAAVYLPPTAARASGGGAALPVLELLHGTNGGPLDWLRRGHAQAILDAFAAAHAGRAPIVVMPDINGAKHVDSECVRAVQPGDVEQYLAVDVVRGIRARFAAAAPSRWAVAGISEGGTCAAMLALRHPSQFRLFGDMSGLAHLTVGTKDDPARTIAKLFDGSRADYLGHDPLWLLSRHRYPELSAWFICGTRDDIVCADQAKVVVAARAAGIETVTSEVLGHRHGWPLWTSALARFLPWAWPRLAT